MKGVEIQVQYCTYFYSSIYPALRSARPFCPQLPGRDGPSSSTTTASDKQRQETRSLSSFATTSLLTLYRNQEQIEFYSAVRPKLYLLLIPHP